MGGISTASGFSHCWGEIVVLHGVPCHQDYRHTGLSQLPVLAVYELAI